MKKLLIALLLIASVSFTACGGAKTEERTETTITTEEVVEDKKTESVVDQYAALLEEYLSLVEGLKKGDADATAKATEIAHKMVKLVEENQEVLGNLAEAAAAEEEEEAKKFVNAML